MRVVYPAVACRSPPANPTVHPGKAVVHRAFRTSTPENGRFTVVFASLTTSRFDEDTCALHLCIIQIVINLLQLVMRRRFNPYTLLLLVVLLAGCAGAGRNQNADTSLSLSDAYRNALSTLTMAGE